MTEKYPHCNQDVLHAPGECVYCDKYPDRQRVRAAGRTPFTPKESNGWYGNVAVSAEEEERLDAEAKRVAERYLRLEERVGDALADRRVALTNSPCRHNWKRGWTCTRWPHVDGPCALVPKWWNVGARWRFRWDGG